MLSTAFWRVVRASLLVVAFGVPFAPLGSQAQQTGQVTPQQFQANPAQVLTNFQSGGASMIALIRQLALADQADLPLIIGLLANANTDQATAIGTGLGQAALASVNTNQAYANDIQTQLAAANNQTASLAWAAVMGDLATAAATTGVGGIGGGVGAVSPNVALGGSPAGLTPSITTSVSNTPDSFTIPSANPGNLSASQH